MVKITKKELKKLHSNNVLRLVAGDVRKTLKEIEEITLKVKPTGIYELARKTGYTDMNSYSDLGITRTAYKMIKENYTFYFLHSIIDNSKDTNTNRSDIFTTTTIYIKK